VGGRKSLNTQQRQKGEFYLYQCVQNGVAACSILIRSCLLGRGVKLTIHIFGYFASRFVRQDIPALNFLIILLARKNIRLQQQWIFQ
jgi:hypothetical protein